MTRRSNEGACRRGFQARRASIFGGLMLALVSWGRAEAAESPGLDRLLLAGQNDPTLRLLMTSRAESSSQRMQESVVHEHFATKAEEVLRSLLTSAQWDFQPDGTFQIVPRDFKWGDMPVEMIDGTYRQSLGAIDLHISLQPSPIGPRASLDGLLLEAEGGYRLEAVVAVSYVEHWSFEVRQFLQSDESVTRPRPPITRIEGIPLDSFFEMTITGNAGGLEIQPEFAFLTVTGPDQFGPLEVGLSVFSYGRPGSLLWNGPTEKTSISGYKVEVRDGHMTAQFNRALGEPPKVWWLAPMSADREMSEIPGDRGRLDLEVRGDEISGDVWIESDLDEAQVVYQATFHGKRKNLDRLSMESFLSEKSLPPSLTESLDRWDGGEEQIAGLWRIENATGKNLGELSLYYAKAETGGIFRATDGSMALTGRVTREFADLQQTFGSETQRWMLRLLPGGELLLGLRYDLSAGWTETIVGWRPPSTEERPGSKDLSPVDAGSSLIRGVLLALRSRCREAIPVLDEGLASARRHLVEEGETIPTTQRILLGTASLFPVQMLGLCDLQVRDYEGYLRHLRFATEILSSMRSAETQALLDESQRLRGGFATSSETLKNTLAELDTWCRASAEEIGESDRATRADIATIGQEMEAMSELLSAMAFDLEAFATSLREHRVNLIQGADALQNLTIEVREQVRRSFASAAADLRKTIDREPRLAQEQDALWLTLSGPSESIPSQMDEISEMFERCVTDLDASEILAAESKNLAMWQLMAAFEMGMIAHLLQCSPFARPPCMHSLPAPIPAPCS